MAKIGARGCTALARWKVGTSTIVLRSDGAVLRKSGIGDDSYVVMFPARQSNRDPEWIGAYLRQRYENVERVA